MGCAGSKHQEPKKEKKKSTTEIVTDAQVTNTSALLVTKETKFTHLVHSTISSENFQVQTVSSTSSTQPVQCNYDLSNNAYVLVFRNDKFDPMHSRQVSANDMKQIKEFCQHYRCDRLDINENNTIAEINSKMEEISERDFTTYSCLIVFIMGSKFGSATILANDGEYYSFKHYVLECCTTNRTLDIKPKLFIILTGEQDNTTPSTIETIKPCMSFKLDTMIFESSYQGTASFRDMKKGNFFMQFFLRLVHKHNRESIMKIYPLLYREFLRRSIPQTPTLTTTLRKDLILGHLLKPCENMPTIPHEPSMLREVYDLSNDAYVLVFHNDEFEDSAFNRPGSAKDMERIQQVLQHYRCDKLDINENKSKEYVQQKMAEISQKDFTPYSCLIVFIMSHGSINDTILASDGKWFYFQEDIVDKCTSNRTLDGKPKLLVLQACRGNDRIVVDAIPPRSDKVDLVIFQSTYQGKIS
uniref:Caspase family p20 domain-containing protein n=2 Tax=Anopheles gambiae TaxID=7165 RepID=A0A1S4H5X2_ANOGA